MPAPQTPLEEPLRKYYERTRSTDFHATALQQLCWLNGNFALLNHMTFFGGSDGPERGRALYPKVSNLSSPDSLMSILAVR
jgi:hypothetical protein